MELNESKDVYFTPKNCPFLSDRRLPFFSRIGGGLGFFFILTMGYRYWKTPTNSRTNQALSEPFNMWYKYLQQPQILLRYIYKHTITLYKTGHYIIVETCKTSNILFDISWEIFIHIKLGLLITPNNERIKAQMTQTHTNQLPKYETWIEYAMSKCQVRYKKSKLCKSPDNI